MWGLLHIGMKKGGYAPLSMSSFSSQDPLCLPSHSFSTKDDRKNSFNQVHSRDIEKFLGKWGKWVSQKGNNAG